MEVFFLPRGRDTQSCSVTPFRRFTPARLPVAFTLYLLSSSSLFLPFSNSYKSFLTFILPLNSYELDWLYWLNANQKRS